MKHFILLFTFLLFSMSGFAANTSTIDQLKSDPSVAAFSGDIATLGLDQFLTLTPNKYRALTGKRMGLRKVVQLKAAQHFIKKELQQEPDITKGLYVLLAIIGLGWLAMGLLDDWSGSDWLVNLILTALCWFPGVIHALIKMKKYF